jgi:hypothetical protein
MAALGYPGVRHLMLYERMGEKNYAKQPSGKGLAILCGCSILNNMNKSWSGLLENYILQDT